MDRKGKLVARSCLRVKSHQEALERKGLRSEPEKSESVCFSYLEVREYPIILGDNPSCRDGPPITIDWKYDPSTKVILDIDVFEKLRGCRRLKVQLLMPRTIRERCILRAGYSSKDVAKAMRQVRRDKHSRAVSVLQTGMDDIYEVKEKVAQGFKKLLCPRATDELLLMEGYVMSHHQQAEAFDQSPN